MLEARGLNFSYDPTVPVLSGVDLDLKPGEIVALLGPSGCGKSTLLRLLAGLVDGYEGSIISQAADQLGFVFQDAALLPWATVWENVALPLALKGKSDLQAGQSALHSVDLVGLEKRNVRSLSGGQRMRVAIARALAPKPSTIFFDEPFAALDEILRFRMNEMLLDLRDQHQLSCLFVTHSVYEAAFIADRVLVMDSGKITAEITPKIDRSKSYTQQRSGDAFFKASSYISKALGGSI